VADPISIVSAVWETDETFLIASITLRTLASKYNVAAALTSLSFERAIVNTALNELHALPSASSARLIYLPHLRCPDGPHGRLVLPGKGHGKVMREGRQKPASHGE
jgi:hypothetical protein